jgi:GNAT superfamily N-acetyltransferase
VTEADGASDVALSPVAEPDFSAVRALAGAIWRQHYSGIISAAQIDYMLAARFNDEALREQIRAVERWLELLRISGAPVGYCGSELAACPGDDPSPPAMTLGQLYVLESHRGMGLGRYMLGCVEDRARDLGRRMLWLQVNKRNAGAIEFYRSTGFEVVCEAVVDIGGGFVMDDFVMAKQLSG